MTEELYLEGKCIVEDMITFMKNLESKIFEYNEFDDEDYYDVNFYKLPYTIFNLKEGTLNKENTEALNNFIARMKASEAFSKVKRTKSGGITNVGAYLHSHPFMYDVINSTSKFTITVVSPLASFKIYVGYVNKKMYKDKKEEKVGGKTPSRRLIKACEDSGIDMEKYANSKEEGLLATKMIHTPAVKTVDAEIDKVYEGNIHHLDFHKFYPSGIVLLNPEFETAFKYLKVRGDKEALDIGTRYLASKYAQYKYAVLVKDGINFMYERFYEVAEDIKNSGRTILAFNTDGIWYQGEVYHNAKLYEGLDFGQWSNDYINVQKIRFASAGCGKYEFITAEGKYEPRYRGQSSYEREVAREKWQWGDIYKGSEVKITFNKKSEQFEIKGAW